MKPTIGKKVSVSARNGLTLIDVMLVVAVFSILGMPSGMIVLAVMLTLALLVVCAGTVVLAMRLLIIGLSRFLGRGENRQCRTTEAKAGDAGSLKGWPLR